MRTLASERRASKPWKYLRLPLLAIVSTMSMGSGMGSTGCNGPDLGRECLSDCQILGTYELTFDDTSEFPAGCLSVEARLPTEPLVISWMYEETDGEFYARVGERLMRGNYYGGGEPRMKASGHHAVTGHGQVHVYTLDGRLDAVPSSTSTPLTWKGTYKVERGNTNPPAYAEYKCKVTRTFTATRVGD